MKERTTICIAGGKGGTGKTTVAANLAVTLARRGAAVTYLDCDVEEPNGHLFLHPTVEGRDRVTVPIPRVDESRCIGCGECADICQFNAIVAMKGSAMVFPELCHSCGGCVEVCPEKAITETALPHLHLLAATRELIGAEVEMVSMTSKEFLLKKPLTELRRAYDYIFFDCPPSLGFLTINALTASASVLVPLQCEYYALEGLSQLLQTVKRIKRGLNPRLTIAGILAMRPPVVVFDEPFSSLDLFGVQQVLRQILALKTSGHTLLVTTHDLDKIIAHVDRILLLHEGRLVGAGHPGDILPVVEQYGVREPDVSRLGMTVRSWLN